MLKLFFHHLDIVVIPYQTKYSEGDHPNGDVEMQARYVKRHFRLISLSRKWYKIWPYLPQNASTKSYTIYSTLPFPLTLNDP